jgi:iron complex transport system substrate-binding protein
MENIADSADPDGLGFPQLSNEYIVDADPDFIFLADGLTLEDVSARPGWSGMSAVANGLVIPVDPDLSSRWGPRMLYFLEEVATAIEALETTG